MTLTQHHHDEDIEPQKVRPHLKVEPPSTWYYRISPNSRTLVILLQVDPAFSDEPKIVYGGFYETNDTFIFAWFSIPRIGHYRWLCGLIHQIPPNSKASYLVRTIQRNLYFLQL